MEFLYCFIFVFFFCASSYALPLNEDNKKLSKPEEIIFFPVYLVETTDQAPERKIQKRQADYLRDEDDVSDEIQDYNKIDTAETRRRYYPYFRIRKVYTSHNNHPRYPASNYADSYDRFPTVA